VEGLRATRGAHRRLSRGRSAAWRAAGQAGQRRRDARGQPRCRAGRGVRGDGLVGQWQEHAHPLHHPPHRAHRREGDHRRAGCHRRHRRRAAGCAPAQGVDGVPALRPAAAPHVARQRRVRAGAAWRRQAAAPRDRRAHARVGWSAQHGRLQTASAQRRPAAACRARPRVGHRPRHHAVRRAVLRARSADPPRDAGRDRAPASRAGQDDDVHHPRPLRGAAPGRPHRHHAQRSVRAGGYARRGGARACRRVRGQLRARRASLARGAGRRRDVAAQRWSLRR